MDSILYLLYEISVRMAYVIFLVVYVILRREL